VFGLRQPIPILSFDRALRSTLLASLFSATLFAVPLSGVTLSKANASEVTQDEIVIAPNLERFVLDNGLEVVVIPDRRAPVVTHMLWYKVGSADEPEGQSGVAHFLEHLMFKGTEDHPDGEFSKIIAERGGQENAFTSYDYTAYFQRVAKEHLPLMMEMEADRMENLVLSDAVVAPERDVVLEERRDRVESDPGSRLREAMNAITFVNHPYGSPIIGWQNEIEALNKDAAIAFYDRFYTPNNAVLVVAGDVEPATVLDLTQDTYGKVPAPGRAGRASSSCGTAACRRTADRSHRSAGQARSYLSHMGSAEPDNRRRPDTGSAGYSVLRLGSGPIQPSL
jgi:zinc protease